MTTTAQRTTTGQLAEFILRADCAALPEEVVHTTKRALLDLLGCALAGASFDDIQAFVRGVKAFDRGDDATIWGSPTRASLPVAAMANGTGAHARELDDVGGPGHVGTVIVPTSLGVGEVFHRSGKEVLAATALGYEVLFRVTDGAGGYGAVVEPGWQPIAVVGGFGAAATAGKLVGLDAEQLTWALGLAGSFTGGSWAFLSDGTMSKRWHPGRAAANGIEGVFLAREGFTGPTEIFEARWGNFYEAHFPQARVQLDAVTAGLGGEYRMLETGFKPYACCRGVHQYLDALFELQGEHGIAADEIASIEVEGTRVTELMIGKRDVQTTVDAQMSLAYTMAVAAYTGKVSLEEYSPRWMGDPRVRRLTSAITISVPEGSQRGADKPVRLALRDGRVFTTRTHEPRGSHDLPLSDDELVEKFNDLARPVVGSARAAEIVRGVWAFDRLDDVAPFVRLLAG